MNNLNRNIKNYLLLTDSESYSEEVHKFCLEQIQDGRQVVLITTKQFIYAPLTQGSQLSGEQLQRLLIMYCRSLGEVNQKLLELYDWSLPHNLVIVDVCHDICDSFVHKIAHCIACLYGFLQSMERQQRKRSSSKASKESKIYCIFSIKFDEQNFTREQVEILKNLYFYENTKLFENFNEIKEKIREENSKD
uniref:Uncharacterized protein n=1 Tax=Glossina austeni TaxID=7395 RepID=A0A1A9UUG9_GLOAU